MLLIPLAAAGLSGCTFHASFGIGSFITSKNYPDAARYQTGAFTYHADEITAIEIYWCSGEIEVIESDEDNTDQVFERFYKRDSARSKTSTGLGLSVFQSCVSRDSANENILKSQEFFFRCFT